MCSSEQVFQSIDFKNASLRRPSHEQPSLHQVSVSKRHGSSLSKKSRNCSSDKPILIDDNDFDTENKGIEQKAEASHEEDKEETRKKEKPSELLPVEEEETLDDFSFDLDNLSSREIQLLCFLLPGVIEQKNDDLTHGVLKVARNIEKQFKIKVLSIMERERDLIERVLRFEQQGEENEGDIEFVKNLSPVDLNLLPKHTMEELVESARFLKTKYYPMIIELLEQESQKEEKVENG
jgi:hypothetical protein